MAETYHILDYKQVKLSKLAILVSGLKDNSRLKTAIEGNPLDLHTFMQAAIVDRLSFLAWTKTKDAQKDINRPQSLVEMLSNSKSESLNISSGEEYEKLREKMLKKIKEKEMN